MAILKDPPELFQYEKIHPKNPVMRSSDEKSGDFGNQKENTSSKMR